MKTVDIKAVGAAARSSSVMANSYFYRIAKCKHGIACECGPGGAADFKVKGGKESEN